MLIKFYHLIKQEDFLFLLFKKEWEDKKTTCDVDFGKLKSFNEYQDFLNQLNDPVIFKLNQVFENENPIFNFKFSNSQSLPDITNSFSTSQMYGDYSAFGLNGGTDGALVLIKVMVQVVLLILRHKISIISY